MPKSETEDLVTQAVQRNVSDPPLGFRAFRFFSGFWFLVSAFSALAAPPTTTPSDPTVQITGGARVRLLPPKVPIAQSQDPLGDITDQMTDVLGDLAAQRTDKPVQAKQQEVVDNLDSIIAVLEKQKSGQQGNSGSLNPSKPMTDSQIAGGPGGIHDLNDPRGGTRNFANLPAKDRDAILQSKTEGFPPGYESLLQSYYQRLAQDKPAAPKP